MKKCEGCGGEVLTFVPKEKSNRCANCGSMFPIEYVYEFKKKPFDDSTNLKVKVDNFAKTTKSLKCESCGATMILNKLQTQSNCPYCGNTSIVEGRKNKLMYIDSIIPFAFSKEEALKSFKKTVSKRFYANKKIFRNVTQDNITGIYVNAFVFDMTTSSSYTGVFTYTISRTDKDGNRKTETVHKHVHGTFDKKYSNITVEANSHIDQRDLNGIEPFQYGSAVQFKEDFMNGYMLEYEDKMFKDCTKTAEMIVRREIERDLLQKYHCERVLNLTLNTNYVDREYNYCLLPVYLINNVYKDKKYTALMNGQTGKVGSLPTSVWRFLLTALLVCGILTGFVLLFIFAF